jgi:DNA-binding beta-propeller fold protein YncE
MIASPMLFCRCHSHLALFLARTGFVALVAASACSSATPSAANGTDSGAASVDSGGDDSTAGGDIAAGPALDAFAESGDDSLGSLSRPDATSAGDGPDSAHVDAGSSMGDAGTIGPAKIVLIAGGFMMPFGVAVDPVARDLYVADYGDNTVRRIDASGMAATVVGPGASGPGAMVTLTRPHDVLFQPGTRNLFIADTFAGRVLRMDAATGNVTVFAGPAGKVPAGGMTFCLAFDAAGTLLYFIASGGITVVDLKTETVKSTLNYANPRVIAVDSKGTLYAVKNTGTASATLQVVDATGNGTDVVGGGPLAAPKHITVDRDDNVVIADTESHTIRKYVVATKTLVLVAGTGTAGTGILDGPPAMAQLRRPHGVFVDAMSRILIADSFNGRVLGIVH